MQLLVIQFTIKMFPCVKHVNCVIICEIIVHLLVTVRNKFTDIHVL